MVVCVSRLPCGEGFLKDRARDGSADWRFARDIGTWVAKTMRNIRSFEATGAIVRF